MPTRKPRLLTMPSRNASTPTAASNATTHAMIGVPKFGHSACDHTGMKRVHATRRPP